MWLCEREGKFLHFSTQNKNHVVLCSEQHDNENRFWMFNQSVIHLKYNNRKINLKGCNGTNKPSNESQSRPWNSLLMRLPFKIWQWVWLNNTPYVFSYSTQKAHTQTRRTWIDKVHPVVTWHELRWSVESNNDFQPLVSGGMVDIKL